MITVFTPTYNRAEYLKRAYRSLLAQTSQNFEWIVIDDGSSDETDKAAEEIQKDGYRQFPFTYLKQKHGGKHRAVNFAVREAKGEFLLILDSDDRLMPHAIEFVSAWGEQIKDKKNIAAVSGLRVFPNGRIIGGVPKIRKHFYAEADNFQRKKYNLECDMAEAYRVDILKKYPFPEYEGEDFIPEGAVWGKIAEDGYIVRWYHEPIYVCEYLDGGLTKSSGMDRIVKNFQGTCYITALSLRCDRWQVKMNWFFHFNRAAHRKGMSLMERPGCLSVPFSVFMKLYVLDLPVYAVFYIGHRIIWEMEQKAKQEK